MTVTNKRFVSIYVTLLAAALCILTIRFFINRSYVSQLPAMPGKNSMTNPVEEQINSALHKAKMRPTAENLGMLGMIYHANAFYEEAAWCYKLAIKRKKSTWKWNYYMGYLNREMGESKEAIRNFTTVIRKNPNAWHAWYYLGEEQYNMGDNRQATASFNEINPDKIPHTGIKSSFRTDYFPVFVYAQYQKARIDIGDKQADSARQVLESIIKDYRSFGPAYRLLGNVYGLLGNMEQSQRYTNRANDLAIYTPPVDSFVDRLSMLSRSEYYLPKKIDEAENGVYPEWAMKLLVNGYKYMPDNKFLISKFIKLCLMMNMGNQPSQLLEKHLSLFKDDYNELSGLGYMLYIKGMYKPSLDYYRVARQLRPDDGQVESSIILCIWKSVSIKAAVDSTLSWLAKNPSDSKVLTEGTGLLLNFKETEKATIYLSKLKRLAPREYTTMSLSGKMEEAKGNLAEAEKLYADALKIKPDDLSNEQNLIKVFLEDKKWEKGIALLRESLGYHPNEPFLLERLGTLLVSCPDRQFRNISEGKEYSERAFIHTRSESATLVSAGRSLAIAYAMLNDKNNAISVLQMTINLAKREGVSQAGLAGLSGFLESLRK
jgi:tetratricopeptide (TPR) repeat protein